MYSGHHHLIPGKFIRTFVVVTAIMVSLSNDVTAEILIDDFNTVGSVPEVDRDLTEIGIGELSARRRLAIRDTRDFLDGDAVASIEVNPPSFESQLVAELTSVPDVPPSYPDHTTFSLGWSISDRADFVTEQENDTVFIDFSFVEGPTPPRTLRFDMTTVQETGIGLWNVRFLKDLPISSEPFTLQLPFDTFADRGGRPITPDFTRVFNFTINAFTGGLFDLEPDVAFRFGIDSVRVGRAGPPLPCDLDRDGLCRLLDIDELVNVLETGTDDPVFDINGDGATDNGDINEWLALAAQQNGFAEPYSSGDVNLDGAVNATDLNVLGLNWLQPGRTWSEGNVFVDGLGAAEVNTDDLNRIALSWQESISRSAAAAVPEPSGALLGLIAASLLLLCRRSGGT